MHYTAHTAQSTWLQWLQVTLISVDGPRWKSTGETEDGKRCKTSTCYEENGRVEETQKRYCMNLHEAFRKYLGSIIDHYSSLLITFFHTFDIFISSISNLSSAIRSCVSQVLCFMRRGLEEVGC